MKNRVSLFVAAACIPLLIITGCSDKSSPEACLYQTTMNLDKGNYDAVLGSPCANDMHKGAAWFGKAGYDIKDVLNRFIDTNDAGNTQSDLNIYMTALIGTVQPSTLTCLDNAKTNYAAVPATSEFHKDALFYTSLVDVMKSLSLLKIVIPNLETNGQLDLSCDKNGNGVPDEADATACALTASYVISNPASTLTCTGASYSPLTPSDMTFPAVASAGTASYSGLTVTILGNETPACTGNTYKRLLYKTPASQYAVATSTEGPCRGSDGLDWPCPVTGANQDLVAALDTSIFDAVSSLTSAVTTTNSDLQTSVNQIHADACKTPCNSVPDCTANPKGPSCPQSCMDGATTYCSSQDVSTYITTYLQ